MGNVRKPGIGEVWPVGMGFRPTDDELCNHYLKRKLRGLQEACRLIPELDIYQWEPQALFGKYDEMSDLPFDGRECFFYCDRNGKNRKNRKTRTGFWKETGKNRIVKGRGGKPIWSKKILVYYEGRQPKGRISQFSMHEYNLNYRSNPKINGSAVPSSPSMEIVLCRIINRVVKETNPDSPSSECFEPDPIASGGDAIANQEDNETSSQVCALINLTETEVGMSSYENGDAQMELLQNYESMPCRIINEVVKETNPDNPSSECCDPDLITSGGGTVANQEDNETSSQVSAPINLTEAEVGMPNYGNGDAEMELLQINELLWDEHDQFSYNGQFQVGESSTVNFNDYGPDDGISISDLWD